MRILYGVVGEGMGHATRSRVVLERLLDLGHEVMVVVSGRAFSFLTDALAERGNAQVLEIHGLVMRYRGNAVDKSESLLANLENAPRKVIENVRPSVEVRSKRVGGANYQVPREVKRHRQQSLAIRWVVDNARKKKGKPFAQRLAEEFVDAYNGTGASVTWKENVHKMAEANRAYAHYAR